MMTNLDVLPVIPEAEALRLRLLGAAEAAFVTHGFHATTMDDVARRAGCSKKTIYKAFESKEAMFGALLRRLSSTIHALRVDTGCLPEPALCAFLEEFGQLVLRDTAVALTRIAMAELAHSPGLVRDVIQHDGGGPARLALEDYLEWLQRQGDYDFGQPHEAARMLMGMALGSAHHEILIGLITDVAKPMLAARIRRSVQVFLRGSAA